MNIRSAVCALLAGAAAAATAAGPAQRLSCLTERPSAPESLGDRAGHSLQVVAATCFDVLAGEPAAVSRIHAIWEQDLAGARLLAATGIVRRPGALAAFSLSEGVQRPVMQDGRPVGWTASGKGVYTLATGPAAALANRTFSWLARSTGPNSYSFESRPDD